MMCNLVSLLTSIYLFKASTKTIIMHQNPILTNKVSMEILDFKVINKYWFSKLFKFKVSNFNLITISSNKSVTNFKITGSYPTLFFNIELVICGCVNGLTVGSKDIENERIWLEHIINSNQIH